MLRIQGRKGRQRACWGTRLKPGQREGDAKLQRQATEPASDSRPPPSYCGFPNEASPGQTPRQPPFNDSLIKSCKGHLEEAAGRQITPP